MAYTTINKSTEHFNTKTYSGNGSTQSITGVGFQPDFTWLKQRTGTTWHNLYDSVRGATKAIASNDSGTEGTRATGLTAFDSDGFSLGSDSNANAGSGSTYTSWNWKAGGTSPEITYNVKVVSDSGNKYRFDDFGTSAVTLDLQEGGTYTFDQSDSSNSGHPLRFYTASDKSGGEYTTGVTTNGTPGSSGAYTRITVAASAPTLYYQCSAHAGMGGQANTNSLFGSSNFSGTAQSTVSVNTTAGFSIVKWTGTGSAVTIGHGLGAKPEIIIVKRLDSSSWTVYTDLIDASMDYLRLDTTAAKGDSSNPVPTNSVFQKNDTSSTTVIAYCFIPKIGFSKFGKYSGNANADGPFVYTGFKPSFVMIKKTNNTANWVIQDNKRPSTNPNNKWLYSNEPDAEYDASLYPMDLLSNGFKIKHGNGNYQNTSDTYLYIAFGQSLVGSNNVPCTAR
jgi:hypothetical protein